MLTMPRLTPQRSDSKLDDLEAAPMASGVTLFVGGLVALRNVGPAGAARLVRGQVATGLRAVGILDNQPGLIPAGSITTTRDGIRAQIRRGTFKLDIDPADPVTAADLYHAVYITDDHQISRTRGANVKSIAGVLKAIDGVESPTGPGAWVTIGELPSGGFPLPTGLSLP